MARHADIHTGDLFALLPQPAEQTPGSQCYGVEVAHLVSQALAGAGCDRTDVAARMSRLAGRDVSKYMLDAWSAESREAYNMPFYLAPVLEVACHTHLLTQWLADRRGCRVLVGKAALDAEIGKLERVRDEAGKKIRALKSALGEMGDA
ncbi:hypothetical protein ACFQ4M_15760 [Thauera mechernichensis]|uniref:Phage protein n=1 Tax=Thauera mechernichensis TaxID=82788 RepID=A0ABW3WG68_9RHOO|nr:MULTISPECIES: hypothetical protein [Thauera]ENO91982.1 hypothetical protein C662_14266 [Thauera sp. 28]MDG3063290.1 hypothetical protein [Thauera mechernichensis]